MFFFVQIFLLFVTFAQTFVIRNENEASFDNKDQQNFVDQIQEFPSSLDYDVNWKFVDNETIRMNFFLFLSKNNDENRRQSIRKFVSNPSTPIETLRFSIFTVEQKESQMKTILDMRPLLFVRDVEQNREYFFESLRLERLNSNERYSVCIFYYRTNKTIRHPDLFICEDFINSNKSHVSHRTESTYTLLVIITQYSIIFGILIILQTSFSMRKRRIADLVHQRLISKAQRFRSSFSSISFVRHSICSGQECGSIVQDEFQSSPTTNQSDSSIQLTSHEENEPFIKVNSNKNHVQFLLGEGEGDESDDIDDGEQTKKSSSHHEPYGEQSDALLSMAHILDSDKPWSKYKRPSISVF